jgi:hypothetical protein
MAGAVALPISAGFYVLGGLLFPASLVTRGINYLGTRIAGSTIGLATGSLYGGSKGLMTISKEYTKKVHNIHYEPKDKIFKFSF